MVSPRAISSPSIKFSIISSTSIFPRWITPSLRPLISTRRSIFAVASSIIIIASLSTELISCPSSVVLVVAISHSRRLQLQGTLCKKNKNKDGEHVVFLFPQCPMSALDPDPPASAILKSNGTTNTTYKIAKRSVSVCRELYPKIVKTYNTGSIRLSQHFFFQSRMRE